VYPGAIRDASGMAGGEGFEVVDRA
jgi:hypothetical protein